MAPRFTSQPLQSKPNGPTPPNSPGSSHALMQAVKITPQARGSAVRSLFDADSPNTPKYQVKDYDAFIEEDLARNKVFTDIEDFMCTVLHLPENWDSPGVYGKTIDNILTANGSFDTARQLYQGVCDKRGIKESDLYDLQVSMLNTALATIRRQHPHVDGHELRFFKNDPTHVFDGVLNINDLSPDLFAVLSSLISDGKGGHVELKMAWAQVLIALETKHLDVTLDSGRGCAYRILTKDGKDPADLHRPDPSPARTSRKRDADEDYAVKPAVYSDTTGKKRAPLTQVGGDPKRVKSALGLAPVPEKQELVVPQIKRKVAPMSQIGRYIMELFAAAVMRSHATVALMDRDRLQLIHGNHSVFLVSNAINIKEKADLRKLIGILIGFHLLKTEHHGIPPIVDQRQRFLTEYVFNHRNKGFEPRAQCVNIGNSITLREGDNPIVIRLGREIYREPGIIGRSTRTLHGSSSEWPGRQLVVKISYPSATRQGEEAFLKKATEKANEMGKEKGEERYWVLDHLPSILYAETKILAEDEESTEALVSNLCTKRKYVGNNIYTYEDRVRRVTVYELLYPLETLTNVRDVAQVFVDVVATHSWLYDHPRILHRDISMDNIMYRIIDGKVYGVLNDFDLASFRDRSTSPSSGQRTGTPPFMAIDILKHREDIQHMYRHDLESIFYVMVVVASRHVLLTEPEERKAPVERHNPIPPHSLVVRSDVPADRLPFQKWFESSKSLEDHGETKEAFLTGSQNFDLSSSFEPLRPWLNRIRARFHAGLDLLKAHDEAVRAHNEAVQSDDRGLIDVEDVRLQAILPPDDDDPVAPSPFDQETLGGQVTYLKILAPGLRLPTPLKGLRYRYY